MKKLLLAASAMSLIAGAAVAEDVKIGTLLGITGPIESISPNMFASVDLAIMVDVYHELAYPYEMLASITRALRPGGRLVFVEYREEDPKVPIKAVHKMSEAQVKREAAVHSLEWVRTVATLPWQHMVIFRRRDGP